MAPVCASLLPTLLCMAQLHTFCHTVYLLTQVFIVEVHYLVLLLVQSALSS